MLKLIHYKLNQKIQSPQILESSGLLWNYSKA